MWILGLSLFFTTPHDFTYKNDTETKKSTREHITLTLQGIFFRPDTHEWVVWINDCRLDSAQQRSLHGWYVIHVTAYYVVLENQDKKKMTLQFKQSATIP